MSSQISELYFVYPKSKEFFKNIHILDRKRGRCLNQVKNHLLRHAHQTVEEPDFASSKNRVLFHFY